MYNNPTTITSGRKVIVQQPIDDRIVFETKSSLQTNINTEALRYYNGLQIHVKEFNENYIWLSVTEATNNINVNENNHLLDADFTYPSVFEPQYANAAYNFYPLKGTGASSNVEWDDIQNKPSSFTPSTHTHEIAEVNGLATELNNKYPLSNPSNFVNASQAAAAAPVQSVAGKTGSVILNKTDVGLSNVDNTTDLDKPISNATQTALNNKQDTLQSGTNIKTVNGESLLGAGNIIIDGGTGSGELNVFITEDGDAINEPDFTPVVPTNATYQNGFVWKWNVNWTYQGKLTAESVLPNETFELETAPINGGSIQSNQPIILSLTDPALLPDGVTPISSANVGATISLEDDVANAVAFTPVVDSTRRTVIVTPDAPLTKGEQYTLAAGAYKRADGATSNIVNISFGVQYAPGFQTILDEIIADGGTLPSNLLALEAFYVGLDNLQVFSSGEMPYLHVARYDGVNTDFFRYNWANPTQKLTGEGTLFYANKQGIRDNAYFYNFAGVHQPMKQAYIDNEAFLIIDRLNDGNLPISRFFFGFNGDGVSGFDGNSFVRVRRDTAGVAANTGLLFVKPIRSANFATLCDASQRMAFNALSRGTITDTNSQNNTDIIGLYALGKYTSAKHAAITALYNTYLSTL